MPAQHPSGATPSPQGLAPQPDALAPGGHCADTPHPLPSASPSPPAERGIEGVRSACPRNTPPGLPPARRAWPPQPDALASGGHCADTPHPLPSGIEGVRSACPRNTPPGLPPARRAWPPQPDALASGGHCADTPHPLPSASPSPPAERGIEGVRSACPHGADPPALPAQHPSGAAPSPQGLAPQPDALASGGHCADTPHPLPSASPSPPAERGIEGVRSACPRKAPPGLPPARRAWPPQPDALASGEPMRLPSPPGRGPG